MVIRLLTEMLELLRAQVRTADAPAPEPPDEPEEPEPDTDGLREHPMVEMNRRIRQQKLVSFHRQMKRRPF